jgi:hypothetical protein
MHRARAAQRHTASELGASHLEHVAKHPRQRGVAVSVHRMRLADYRENICHSAPVILSRVTVRCRKRPNLGVHRRSGITSDRAPWGRVLLDGWRHRRGSDVLSSGPGAPAISDTSL